MSEQQAVTPSTQIAVYAPIEAGIIEFLARHQNVVHDVTTTKGMEAARKDRAECRSLRVKLEDARVREKAESLAYGRKVDDEAKRIRTIIEGAEDRYDSQIKARETELEAARKERERIEAERVAAINKRIDWIVSQPAEFIGKPADAMQERIDMLAGLPVDAAHYAEFLPRAIEARDAAVAMLRNMHADTTRVFAEAARLKAEREAFERQQEEARVTAAAERARIAEEQRVAKAALDAEAAAERRRLEEEARVAREAREAADAKAKAERDEQDRIAADKRAAEEKAARERQVQIDQQQAEADRLAREKREREEAEAKAARDAEQKRLAAERAELERQQAELRRQQEADAAALRQRQERERAEAERQEAARARAAAFASAKRPTMQMALEQILFVAGNHDDYTDPEARAEIAILAEANLPQTEQAAA